MPHMGLVNSITNLKPLIPYLLKCLSKKKKMLLQVINFGEVWLLLLVGLQNGTLSGRDFTAYFKELKVLQRKPHERLANSSNRWSYFVVLKKLANMLGFLWALLAKENFLTMPPA